MYSPEAATGYLSSCYARKGRDSCSAHATSSQDLIPSSEAILLLCDIIDSGGFSSTAKVVKSRAMNAFNAEIVFFHTVPLDSSNLFEEIDCGAVYDVKQGVGVLGNAFNSPLEVQTCFNAAEDEAEGCMGGLTLRNFMCGNLKESDGTSLGWLTVANKSKGRSYTNRDVEVFRVFVRTASIVMQHAERFESAEKELARLSSMVDIIQTIHDCSTKIHHTMVRFGFPLGCS